MFTRCRSFRLKQCFSRAKWLGTCKDSGVGAVCPTSRTQSHICTSAQQQTQWLTVASPLLASPCVRELHCTSRLYRKSKRKNVTTETDMEGGSDGVEEIELPEDNLFDYGDQNYMLPDAGHRVFLLQPDDKTCPKSMQLTTPKLKMDEAHALIETLPNWKVVERAIYSTKTPRKKTMFGKGNFSEITEHIAGSRGVSAVFVGVDMLSAVQLQCLQDEWKLPVYDRYTVVLQIFQTHARTKEAKLQVALAEIPYIRSRLRGIHERTLDQQRGGLHSIGGAGETYLEQKQQHLQERETKLKKVLVKVKAQRELLRSNRLKKQIPIVAVVGYTNSGKTTLIKTVSGDDQMEPRDQLFATLDVTAHGVSLPNKMTAVFMDTVGFISDIPTGLIESFAATLEDALIADVIVHVRDVSHPDTEMQKVEVLKTLRNLDISEKLLTNVVEVCNKTDKLNSDQLDGLRQTGALCMSATKGTGVAQLMSVVQEKILTNTDRMVKKFRVPMDGQHLSWLHKESTVQDTEPCDDNRHFIVETIITTAAYGKFKAKFSQS